MKRSLATSTALVLIAISALLAPDNASAELTIVRQFDVGEGGYPPDMMMGTKMTDFWPLVPNDMSVMANLTMMDSVKLRFEAPPGLMIEVRGQAMADFWALMWDRTLPDIPFPPDDPDPQVDIGHAMFIGFMDMSMVGTGMPPMTMDGSNFNRDGSAVIWRFAPDVDQDPLPSPFWSFTAIEMTVDVSGMPDNPDGTREYTVVGEGLGGLYLQFADPNGFSRMTPEPITALLFGAAALPLLRRRRRKRANK